MGLKKFFQFQNDTKSEPKQKAGPSTKTVAPVRKSVGLCDIFKEGIQLKEVARTQLATGAEEGVAYFNGFNEDRISHAFESFDPSMRFALYEIIYLLHANTPQLKELKYQVFTTDKKKGSSVETTVNLYMEGVPSGVKGISNLSPVFQKDFVAYINKTFDDRISEPTNTAPIEGIYSIGSIGTVGHKNIASDLDLEVQYCLEPSQFDISPWNDKMLKEVLLNEHGRLIKRYYQKKGVDPEKKQPAEQSKKVSLFFRKRIEEKYPTLFSHLISKKVNAVQEVRRNRNQKLRYQLLLEIIDLIKADAAWKMKKIFVQQEQSLKQRILKIQNYVQTKFPEAEIYLFPFSRTDLQKGNFGSTLDSKESSGSAYELILNYETLMPGIYFTPVIPSHFLFSQQINNSHTQFENFNQFIQFGLLDFCNNFASQINYQGPTPDLDSTYVANHHSAAYWEAFKASSGNLPKATLNILRYEMMLEDKLRKTTIQLIKEPDLLNSLIPESDSQSAGENGDRFSAAAILEIEEEFPALRFDPWWLRYKMLKIAYGTPGLIRGTTTSDAENISRIIDFAFALHIRVSDVFTKPGDTRKFDKHREKVLRKLLGKVFPEGSDKLTQLKAIFIGDVQTVADFEKDLRQLFLKSIERIQEKVKNIIKIDEKTTKEFEIWHHYYLHSFKPGPNVVQRSILNHLQVPRGRLQIGFIQKKGWFFRSLQKGLSVGKRFESSILSLLPEEVMLMDNTIFLKGLVYCVINGYYGIFNEGMLNETKTEVEFDRKHTDMGSKFDNQLAFVRPDQIERIMKQITALFTYKKISYLDCIQTTRTINEVMIFLNLLKMGRVSILTRDNLDTIYVDQFDVPKFNENIEVYIGAFQKMLTAKFLHILLRKFFESKKIDLNKVILKTWVNPNSVETNHAATKYAAKEDDLAEHFHAVIMKIHSKTQLQSEESPGTTSAQ
ncbi:MAG: hypothetical protein HQ517_08065 [SAR324 cluster bacterium]|nr:hypothetical protein [SAR324 cluster bacterium]